MCIYGIWMRPLYCSSLCWMGHMPRLSMVWRMCRRVLKSGRCGRSTFLICVMVVSSMNKYVFLSLVYLFPALRFLDFVLFYLWYKSYVSCFVAPKLYCWVPWLRKELGLLSLFCWCRLKTTISLFLVPWVNMMMGRTFLIMILAKMGLVFHLTMTTKES